MRVAAAPTGQFVGAVAEVDRRGPDRRSLMVNPSAVRKWTLAVTAGDRGELDSLWAEFTPILEQLAEEWLSKSLQRAELDQVADSSPVKSLHLQLKNGELRFRGSDELWRLVAAVALSRLPDSEIESSMKFASQMVQVIRPLLDELADADLESAALLKLTGSTNDEIARHMSCTRRTVQRLLKLIRDICESQIKP